MRFLEELTFTETKQVVENQLGIDVKDELLKQKEKENEEQRKEIEDMKRANEQKEKEIAEQKLATEEQKRAMEEQRKEIEDMKRAMKELQKAKTGEAGNKEVRYFLSKFNSSVLNIVDRLPKSGARTRWLRGWNEKALVRSVRQQGTKNLMERFSLPSMTCALTFSIARTAQAWGSTGFLCK